ncbi:MAG: NAD(P)-dependent alcohol dehydrogenase [Chloroflexi bacterium]|nr:NAD(P)-dependent alcohol dehydrogenase [Chloroflexota bacterium]MBU1747084.1 NAD(P)-dependent alcohol dehydrogenase [Chloroflexota bacterium]
MKAIVYTKYGPPSEVLQLQKVENPTPKDDEVLVKVLASSVNQGDVYIVKGEPLLFRPSFGLPGPKHQIPGGDVAGRVEAVGKDVEQFQPGDEVFGDIGGCGFGAFAEYVAAPENALVLKPANTTFEEAAAVAQAAIVALQGLRDKGRIQAGQRVLINGASGSVGTFAVQIAKSFGAEVTGVCSTRNLDLVRSIGADQVIDYTQEDFTRSGQQYDLIFDIVANRSVSDYRRALRPKGNYVACAISAVALLLGPLISMFGSKKVVQLSHSPNDKDLVFMKELLEAGKVIPVIDRRYPLSEVAQAFRHYEEGHPRGKVVITVKHDDKT